ncbi:MAG: hypothetical protein ABI266_03445, partial [Ginsengibacter sp.]
MKTTIENEDLKPLYYRLIALWVICEGVAGGIMHGLQIPFSGMLISGSAVICICLIGYFIPVRGAILKATLIVLIFKMMISPHTPPTAYLAVTFQGLIGQLLFSSRIKLNVIAFVLGILALVESAVQKILVLIFLYGSNFWSAINDFVGNLLHAKKITNYTLWLAVIYLFLHVIGGILIGWIVIRIVQKAKQDNFLQLQYLIETPSGLQSYSAKKSSGGKKYFKWGLMVIWIGLILLFLQSLFNIGTPLMSSGKALYIFLRSMLIFLTWYFLVSPLITRWIKSRLKIHEKNNQVQMNAVLSLLPAT